MLSWTPSPQACLLPSPFLPFCRREKLSHITSPAQPFPLSLRTKSELLTKFTKPPNLSFASVSGLTSSPLCLHLYGPIITSFFRFPKYTMLPEFRGLHTCPSAFSESLESSFSQAWLVVEILLSVQQELWQRLSSWPNFRQPPLSHFLD